MSDDVNYDDADFGLDGGNYSPTDLEGGGSVKKPGFYHFEITEVKPDLNHIAPAGSKYPYKKPSICFVCSVLAGPKDGSPVGAKAYHRIYLRNVSEDGELLPPAEGAVKAAMRFGLGVGLLAAKQVEGEDREIVVVKETGSTNITPKVWEKAFGRQFIGEIEHRPADGNYKERWEFAYAGWHACDDPKYADVPCDEGALAAIGVTRPKKGAAPQPAKAAPPKQPQSKPQPAATDVPLDF